MVSISVSGAALPSPDELRVSNEIIWSSNTGRTASGLMVGDAIAEKQTLAIRWGVLTKAQLSTIKGKLVSGFFPLTLTIDGESVTVTNYRGVLTAEILGTFGGVTYYRSASANVIQQ